MATRFSSLLPVLLLAACVPDERPKPSPVTEGARSAPRPPEVPPPRGAAAAPEDPALTAVFRDGFDRPALGPDWNSTSPVWRIDGGRLCGQGAKNHPVWLKRRLPANARVEFDAETRSPDGDLKAEFWGDGRSAATTVSYTAATSYLTIFGGWKNQFHVLARIDEHALDRPEIRLDDSNDDPRTRRVLPGRPYRFKVVREDGKTIHWSVDDLEILSFADPRPLAGPGHEHFGLNDWDVPVCFDNLVVTPLP